MSGPAAFTQWVARAESRAASVTGLGLDELGAEGHSPGYRDAFDADYTPVEFADEVIAASGFPVGPYVGVPVARRADTIRSADITTGLTYLERLTDGSLLKAEHIRLALDQRKVTGRLPILYGKKKLT